MSVSCNIKFELQMLETEQWRKTLIKLNHDLGVLIKLSISFKSG